MSAPTVIVSTHTLSVEVSVKLEIDDTGSFRVLDVAAEAADGSEVSLKLANIDLASEYQFFADIAEDLTGK